MGHIGKKTCYIFTNWLFKTNTWFLNKVAVEHAFYINFTFFLFESAIFVKLFFFFYFVCKTELVGQNDQLEKSFFHETFVHLIFKIKHKEELLKDILFLGKSLDFSNPLHFISTIQKMGKFFCFYDTGKG